MVCSNIWRIRIDVQAVCLAILIVVITSRWSGKTVYLPIQITNLPNCLFDCLDCLPECIQILSNRFEGPF